MIQTLPGRTRLVAEPALGCAVAAFGTAETTAAELPALRQQLATSWAGALAAPLFRQADDQSILALAALAQARVQPALTGVDFTNWGVLAAPRYFARAAMAASLERTRRDGPWGVSPHFVAHRSLHSLPGLLSLALKSHGPNLGVGGGPGAESEVLLTAAVFLQVDRMPGVWVVLTAWNPEPTPTTEGEIPPDSVGRAVALALTPAEMKTGLRLCLSCRSRSRLRDESVITPGPFGARDLPGGFTLESLHAALRASPVCPTIWLWSLELGTLELNWPGTAEVEDI